VKWLPTALVAVALVLTGCRARTTYEWEVPPGRFAELDFEAPPGARATATFAGTHGRMHWNIHTHANGQTIVAREGTTPDGGLTFEAPPGGRFSFLWENTAEEWMNLDVRLELADGVRVTRAVPDPR
jgi:hypothetical protein